MNCGARGSFMELLKTADHGQISVNIINLSDTEILVMIMWANEAFAPRHPDTFERPV